MEPASTNVMITHVLQNKHVNRVWKFLRPEPTKVSSLDSAPSASTHDFEATEQTQAHGTSQDSEAQESASVNDVVEEDGLSQGQHHPDTTTDEGQDDEQMKYGYDCTMEDEAEEDYTNGPCRLRIVPDGDKFSAALMLKFDLSARIKRVIESQRSHQKKQTQAELQLDEFENFEDKLREVIDDKEFRLGTDLGGDDADVDAIASINRELEILKILAGNTKMKKEILSNNLRWSADELLERQTAVMEYLNEAFIEALLIGSGDAETLPVEVLDLETEYQDVHRALYEDSGATEDYIPESLKDEDIAIRTKEMTDQSPEQLARAELESAVWEARAARNDAERAFDSRGSRRDREWQEHRVAEFNGLPTSDTNKEEFDLRWVLDDRLTTRAFIEAEENLIKAKAAAVSAGIEVVEPEDDIPEYAYEFPGHPLSGEKEVGVIIPNTGVEAWRDSVADLAGSGEIHEDDLNSIRCAVRLDYWDSREVEMGDSGSCVDWEYYAEDIVKWQIICAAPRNCRAKSI